MTGVWSDQASLIISFKTVVLSVSELSEPAHDTVVDDEEVQDESSLCLWSFCSQVQTCSYEAVETVSDSSSDDEFESSLVVLSKSSSTKRYSLGLLSDDEANGVEIDDPEHDADSDDDSDDIDVDVDVDVDAVGTSLIVLINKL